MSSGEASSPRCKRANHLKFSEMQVHRWPNRSFAGRGRSTSASRCAGQGLPVFSDLAMPRPLKLMSSKAFPAGSVAQIYRPA